MVRLCRSLLLLLVCTAAIAEVEVRVDRSRVELNESFSLEVSIDTNVDVSPDTTPLEEDFFVGSVREMSNTSIVNGQIQRSRSWQYALMAKRAGTLTIPSLTVGSETSEPVSITVVEPTYEPPGEADVFITTEIDTDSTYVQAQILYRIKVYRAVATRQPTLSQPTFAGAEVLIEPAGDESNYEARLGGKAYSVNERVFALFPQESGQIEISPARFEARVLRNGRITGRKVFTSESHTIDVQPIPPAPAEYPDAAWLPARDVTLAENWSAEPDELTAGEPITRVVRVTALGQLETQIPVIEPPSSPSVNVYADKPELTRTAEERGIRGVREDQYALIGIAEGSVELPELKLPWFNLDTGEWQVASLPPREIRVLPADDALTVMPEAPTEQAVTEVTRTVTVESPFWRRISQFLGGAWALTLLAWWYSSRPTREQRVPTEPPLHKKQARFLKDARTAAKAGDAERLKTALMDWARLEWPDAPPRSVGALARRVSEPLATELAALSRSTYGGADASWDGDAMAKAIRSFHVIRDTDTNRTTELLPPLMPS